LAERETKQGSLVAEEGFHLVEKKVHCHKNVVMFYQTKPTRQTAHWAITDQPGGGITGEKDLEQPRGRSCKVGEKTKKSNSGT